MRAGHEYETVGTHRARRRRSRLPGNWRRQQGARNAS